VKNRQLLSAGVEAGLGLQIPSLHRFRHGVWILLEYRLE
jgi:hypothetical protein